MTRPFALTLLTVLAISFVGGCAADMAALRKQYSGNTPAAKQAESECVQLETEAARDYLIREKMPRMPTRLRGQKLEAELKLKLVFTAEGDLVKVLFVEDDERFSDSVMEAVSTWRFKPYTKDDKPVPVCTDYRFVFRIQ